MDLTCLRRFAGVILAASSLCIFVNANADLLVSTSLTRSSPMPLAGRSISGNIYAFTTPINGVKRVRFFVDNPSMSGTPRRTESYAPYDFADSNDYTGTAYAFNTTTVADGSHTITAAIDLNASGTAAVGATFTVANTTPPPPLPPPNPPVTSGSGSQNYLLFHDLVASGGGSMTSPSYRLRAILGQTSAIGESASGEHRLIGGARPD